LATNSIRDKCRFYLGSLAAFAAKLAYKSKPKARLIYCNNLSNYRSSHYSFLLPFILQQIGGDITSESEPLVKYLLSITVLCVIVLVCFINVLGYIFSLYLIPKFGLDKKYPKIKTLLSFFEKSSFFLIIIEIIIGFVFLASIIILNTLLIVFLI
jgi:hypothetical protein